METAIQYEHSLEERAVAALKAYGYTISTAESCTGGLLAGRLVNAAGASDVFQEGYITYSNDAKEKLLQVSHAVLGQYGAVSSQTAEEMARGAAKAADAQVSLATTGIAGPGGGTAEKPVGLVYISCYINGVIVIEEHVFAGERAQVRAMAVEAALTLLLSCLDGRAGKQAGIVSVHGAAR